jgi:hypothetical protein
MFYLSLGLLKPNIYYNLVGMATGCGLDARGVGVRVPVGSRIFSPPRRPDRPMVHPASYAMDIVDSFHKGKAAGVWNWPNTSN